MTVERLKNLIKHQRYNFMALKVIITIFLSMTTWVELSWIKKERIKVNIVINNYCSYHMISRFSDQRKANLSSKLFLRLRKWPLGTVDDLDELVSRQFWDQREERPQSPIEKMTKSARQLVNPKTRGGPVLELLLRRSNYGIEIP